ncbi:MAG TPA: hypothetical protein DD381_11560 [Lentisphaeria bacterium]|nr:MAG: hypothetical protein A2X47_10095 [Lentisphaerae bacterium GWF2_38_69]HBM16965.1 hypothetical protein [Lentisphaeria bacterium]
MKITKKAKWITISLIVILFCILIFYVQGGYTSDAYIRANWTEISPRVEEFVTQVYVGTNTFVKQSDKLFQLDPYSYKMTVETLQAQIELANATKQLYSDQVTNYKLQLKAITDQLKIDVIEVERYKFLMDKQAQSTEEYQRKLYDYEKDKVEYTKIQTAIDDAKNNEAEQVAIIKQLTAQLNNAKYNLESTLVKAPFAGFIVNNYLMPGMYLHAGQSVFGIVQSQECWVEANFKEFWVGRIKPGQKVFIMPDLYPFKIIEGEVVSILNAISREQAVDKTLPYIEPTIDWIRLQQRFTVLIKILNKPQYMNLKMGSSARVYVLFW